MSIESKINEIIESYPEEGWEERSTVFLHDTTRGVPLEKETLHKIAYGRAADLPSGYSGYCDSETIAAIAAKDKRDNWDPLNPEKCIKIYRLEHRSGYPVSSITPTSATSKEVSYTSSEAYKSIADELGLGPVTDPSEQNQGYENISIVQDYPVYHIVEKGRLFGKELPYGFTYRMSTAACVFNGETGDITDYPGYFYEGMGDIPGITTTPSGASGGDSFSQYFVYTPGGGPVSASNWIFKMVECSYKTYRGGAEYSQYTYHDGTRIMLKFYIHFFFPDGSYVRRMVDRSDIVKEPADLNNLSLWRYEDYVNSTARTHSLTFPTVWNSCYPGMGGNKISGKPNNNDFSLFWNLGQPMGIANGKAIPMEPALPVWDGKGA